MASLWITEFSVAARMPDGGFMPAGRCPARNTQKVAFTTASLSSAFGGSLIRVFSDTDCFLDFGSAPTATTSGIPLTSGAAEYFGVEAGHKLSVYDGVS